MPGGVSAQGVFSQGGVCLGGVCPLGYNAILGEEVGHVPRQVWIQDLVKGGGPASEAKSCQCSKASNLQLGSRACLRALEAFGFLMLKNAFSHILETLFV